MTRATLLAGIACLLLTVWAAPASGSVTVGQVAPGTSTSCSSSFEFLGSSTADYAMPATGTITSWTHHAQANLNQTPTLKIYRKVGDPGSYQVVAHDGPNPIGSTETKTFPTSLPVKAGDVLGITGAGGANIGCSFTGPGELSFRMGNLADGGIGDFSVLGSNSRVNVSAVLDPTNSFTHDSTVRNKKKGTATLNLTLPNPGELTGTGTGVSASSAGGAVISKAVSAGAAQLLVRATGKKRKKLKAKGKVALGVTVTYTPTGGAPSSQSVSVLLKKKNKK